jgi:lipopolysaccharide biosynthesis glycosyltransferase
MLEGLCEDLKFNKYKHKKVFHVAFCTDDNYVLQICVAADSLMQHSKPEQFYEIFILISQNVTQAHKKMLFGIRNKFKNCTVRLVDMGDKFKNANHKGWGTPMFYRLYLPYILTVKWLYLDGDVVVRKDISELFEIDMYNHYVAGVRDMNGYINPESNYHKEVLEIPNLNSYICSGVMLINSGELVDNFINEKFLKMVEEYGKENKFVFPDQDIINISCFGHILVLPCKYGFLGHTDYENNYENSSYAKWTCTRETWDEGRTDPYIIHYTNPKPWVKWNKFAKYWWEAVDKADCKDQVYEKYNKRSIMDS